MNYDVPHRRYNPLTRDWVLVSPHRGRRPWLGQVEKVSAEDLPPYDPGCYLCPGNERAGGIRNPDYGSTFVFDNDFPALLFSEDLARIGELDKEVELRTNALFRAEPEAGICRVVCFSPRHDLTLPELSLPEIEAIIQTWTEQTRDLGSRKSINYVQVFENKGAAMGCSNPHPHSQIWALTQIPNEPAREVVSLADYREEHQACMLCDYLQEEKQRQERIVAANASFTALIPFWAVWPFEILLLSNRHVASLMDLSPTEVSGLADILKQVTTRFDNLFEVSFPYSMGFHQAPTNDETWDGWHLHAHYYPPLLRSATVRKFMVGFEMLAMPQRDLTPETAADRLRKVEAIHYSRRPPTGESA
jgi:UDPglucose--hexose-1-phosphate uridylyltransferase